MGQSTDALMAFGFDLGEDEELPEAFRESMRGEDGDDFDPDVALPRDYGFDVPQFSTVISYKKYAAARDAALAQIPVDIVAHCSGEYTMRFLCVRGTSVKARRGYPSEAPQRTIAPSEIDALRAFCDKHGIEWQEPRWYIFSMWF